jgi:hypothetical protein
MRSAAGSRPPRRAPRRGPLLFLLLLLHGWLRKGFGRVTQRVHPRQHHHHPHERARGKCTVNKSKKKTVATGARRSKPSKRLRAQVSLTERARAAWWATSATCRPLLSPLIPRAPSESSPPPSAATEGPLQLRPPLQPHARHEPFPSLLLRCRAGRARAPFPLLPHTHSLSLDPFR